MPSEWNPIDSSSLPQSVDCDLKNDDTFLQNFKFEIDALLPEDDILEPKMCLENNFFDSFLEGGNHFQWSDMFSQFSNIREEISQLPNLKEDVGDIPIKLEPLSMEFDLRPSDSTGSLCSNSESSNSSEPKCSLETPPVSPPVAETSLPIYSDLPMNNSRGVIQKNKSTLLRLNPSNVKIIQNIKGLKPIGKNSHQIVLPKRIIEKAIKFGPEGGISELSTPSNIQPIPTQLGNNQPVILTTSQIGGSPTITVIPHETNNLEVPTLTTTAASSTSSKPHILPLIKQESDILIKNELHMKALKRQQRMIKNRESACLSRKKKKEYVSSLESKISDLENENNRLKIENDILKSRVKELETCNRYSGKSQSFLNSNLRKTTAIFAVLLMVSVNIGSLSLLSREGQRSNEFKFRDDVGISGDNIVKHGGRSLLWTQTDPSSDTYSNGNISNTKDPSICPLYINQTESLRLEKELRQWIAVDKKRSLYGNSTRRSTAKQIPLRQLILHSANKPKIPYKTHRKPSSAVEVYHPPFPGSLPRREDTFYVFSFSSDHLLVPAVTHNNTLRPKMSFVIPTVPLNDSFINSGSVPMMQIDCEVLATRSIKFTEKDFKLFRPKEEATRKDNNTAQVAANSQPYRPYFIQRSRVRPNAEFDDGFEGYMNRVYQAANTFP